MGGQLNANHLLFLAQGALWTIVLSLIALLGGGLVGFVCGGRRRGEPAPEHLGDKMLFRREVRIGGGRSNARLGGHATHGKAGKSLTAQEVDSGPAEAVYGIGLFGGQTAPSRLQGRIGHMSGRYYNCL